ncbi:MAG: hypothetical protein ACLRSW_13920 [Christensenellaceae bacterium]
MTKKDFLRHEKAERNGRSRRRPGEENAQRNQYAAANLRSDRDAEREAERLITNEILSEEKQIELLQAIDRHCFRQAQTIVEEAARYATAQNFEHLISDLDTLSKKLFEVSRL